MAEGQVNIPQGLAVIPKTRRHRWSGRTAAREICRKIILPTDPSGCWLQTTALNDKGYARWGVLGRRVYGHRAVYEMFNGPIPDGRVLDHLCRNTACVNPSHVEVVTQAVNMARSISRCSKIATCKRGHPLSGDNMYYLVKYNKRICRVCRTIRRRNYECRKTSK